jgi:hypothetical protein
MELVMKFLPSHTEIVALADDPDERITSCAD